MTRSPVNRVAMARVACAAMLVLLVLTSCGGGHIDTGGTGAADESIASLAEAYAPCDVELDAVSSATGLLSETVRWMNVAALLSTDGDLERTSPAKVALEDGSEEVVRVHGSYVPGMKHALETGGSVWLAIGDPENYGPETFVIYVLVTLIDGRSYFPGLCQHRIVYEPLAASLGTTLDETLLELRGLNGEQISGLIGVEESQDLASEIVILNPETAPEGLLESLYITLLHVTVSVDVGPGFTICTRIDAGWNDCFEPTGQAAEVGVPIDAYVDSDGELEFWLLNENADPRSPLAELGSISFSPPKTLLDSIALRVEIDTETLRDSQTAIVSLIEAIPIDDSTRQIGIGQLCPWAHLRPPKKAREPKP